MKSLILRLQSHSLSPAHNDTAAVQLHVAAACSSSQLAVSVSFTRLGALGGAREEKLGEQDKRALRSGLAGFRIPSFGTTASGACPGMNDDMKPRSQLVSGPIPKHFLASLVCTWKMEAVLFLTLEVILDRRVYCPAAHQP